MPLSNSDRIQIKQILRVQPLEISELDTLITNLTDPDAIAAIGAAFIKWNAVQLARNPNRAGLIKADVVEWNAEERCEALCKQEGNIRYELASALGWELKIIFPF